MTFSYVLPLDRASLVIKVVKHSFNLASTPASRIDRVENDVPGALAQVQVGTIQERTRQTFFCGRDGHLGLFLPYDLILIIHEPKGTLGRHGKVRYGGGSSSSSGGGGRVVNDFGHLRFTIMPLKDPESCHSKTILIIAKTLSRI